MENEHHQEALRARQRSLVARRRIPPPYTTVADVMEATEKRIKLHPRGFVGVADEMDLSRKTLWSYLRGIKVPEDRNLAKMAQALQKPLPAERAGFTIEVKSGVPIPPRASYLLRTAPVMSSKFSFIRELKKGDYFEIPYKQAKYLRPMARTWGIKIITRALARDRIGVWIQ